LGVEKTRTFLLEWQAWLCRYVPVGVLEVAGPAPPPPSGTKWTRLVHPSVLIGHVSPTESAARPALPLGLPAPASSHQSRSVRASFDPWACPRSQQRVVKRLADGSPRELQYCRIISITSPSAGAPPADEPPLARLCRARRPRAAHGVDAGARPRASLAEAGPCAGKKISNGGGPAG